MNMRFLSLFLCVPVLASCGSDDCKEAKPTCEETCAGEAVEASCNDGKWECKVDPVLCAPCDGDAPACVASCTDGGERWAAVCRGGAWACEQGVMVEPGCNPDACEPVYTGDRCKDGVVTCDPSVVDLQDCPSKLCSTCNVVNWTLPLLDPSGNCECTCKQSTDEVVCIPVDLG